MSLSMLSSQQLLPPHATAVPAPIRGNRRERAVAWKGETVQRQNVHTAKRMRAGAEEEGSSLDRYVVHDPKNLVLTGHNRHYPSGLDGLHGCGSGSTKT